MGFCEVSCPGCNRLWSTDAGEGSRLRSLEQAFDIYEVDRTRESRL